MARGDAFDRRKKSLQKMAWELSELCGVDVALVVAAAAAAGVPAAWESREGVMARYRALAPEARARHTHRAYLEAKLGKEEATLARVRQAGPVGLRVDAALGMLLDGAAATAEDARQLLDVIDAAIRAADARRAALGMPADGGEDGAGNGVVLEGVAPLRSVPGAIDGGDYDYLPHHGGAGEHAIWGGNDGFQPFTCGATAEIMRPGGYGFQFQEQCDTSGAGMDGYYYNLQMAPPAMYGDSSSSSHVVADAYPYHQVLRHAPHPNPNLSPMWSAAAADDMVPAEYTSTNTGLSYYNYMVGTPAAASASLQGNGSGMSFATAGATSGNFVYSPPELSLATGNDIGGVGSGNFINAPPAPIAPLANTTGGAGGNFTYATPAQPLAVSYGGELTDAGWYASEWQQPRRDVGGQEPIEQLHCLSDLEDRQMHLWGN
ncbi:unnamed protein product [Urochloa decumbens]|uniref:MADS-box domain-containing protein n=1 Tax=Urochloa decumbens TaxID=240449 RepID=A0ABC9BBI1_9POAL